LDEAAALVGETSAEENARQTLGATIRASNELARGGTVGSSPRQHVAGARTARTWTAFFACLTLVAGLCASVLAGPAAAAGLAVDALVNGHQTTPSGTITSPTFSTTQSNELLVAFIASDGPSPGSVTFSSVSGGALTWTLRVRSNVQPGTAEIWQAVAPSPLAGATVTATRSSGSWVGSITVVSFSGASTTTNGATASTSAATGAPTASLTTTAAGSWTWGVGNDWSAATNHTVGANQTLVDQFLAPVGDTYWVQRQASVTPNVGTTVTINDTTPTADRWDLAAVEVVPSGGGSGTPPPTAPSNLTANPISGTEVDLSWTASTSQAGVANYKVIRNGTTVGTPTSTAYNDTGVTGGQTYTYTVVAVDTLGQQSPASNSVTVTTPAPGADQVGQWSSVISYPEVSIHSALLPNGKVLTFQGDFTHGGQQYVFDPATNNAVQVPDATADLFCAGQAVFADGRVAVIGGTSTSGGLGVKNMTAFDWSTQTWQNLAPMTYPRWYATGTTAGDGRVLVTSGDNTGANDIVPIPEIYNVQTNSWTSLTGANNTIPIYPFMYQLPDGRFLQAGASETPTSTQILDISQQHWTTLDSRSIDGGSIVNYAPNKFMKAGSATDDGGSGPSANTAYKLDMTQPSPQWQPTSSMANPRSFLNLTALPDGNVLATGGGTDKSGFVDANAVAPAEQWNPATGQWKTLASLTAPRLYHSVATLLPDGRVFVSGGGGDPGVSNQQSVQIYSPPYLFKGPRPTITSAPGTGQYGSSAVVATPDAASIASVSLIRTGSVTHAFDQNARAIPLSFTQTAGGLNVQMPPNGNTAPPGYYMLSIVNSQGVPSVSSFVRFPAPYEDSVAPSAPTNLSATAASPTRVNLSWTAATDNMGVTGYNVLRNGVKIATSTTTSYNDTSAASDTSYDYTVTAYDAAGNTGPPSNVASVTTPVDTTPPAITNIVATPSTTTTTITWRTDKPSSSQVFYGTTTAYGSSTALDATLVTSHTQTVSGLSSSTAYHYAVQSKDGSGNTGTSPDQSFTTPAVSSLAVDKMATTHPTTSATTVTSPSFTTTQGNELLLAFVNADGPNSSGSQNVQSVTGGGLTWTLRVRANGQAGDSEVWQAVAPGPLTNATVTATLKSAAVRSLTVVSFIGADTTVNGATATGGAVTGAPAVSLTTTKAGSWVWGAGSDWSKATARTVGAGQTLVDQYLAPGGDTYWVQRQTNVTPASGTSVTINDTAPTADKWNLVAIEVRPAM
jgi:fibronectin type 3 domain-containing protein